MRGKGWRPMYGMGISTELASVSNPEIRREIICHWGGRNRARY